MSAAIKYLLFALMLASITSIVYWAAFDVTWWVPLDGITAQGRTMVLYMLHMAALLGLPFYMCFPRQNHDHQH